MPKKLLLLIRNYGTDTLSKYSRDLCGKPGYGYRNRSEPAPKDSLQYTFTKTVDMSVYQAYQIKAWVSDPTDNYHNNDSSANYTIQTTPVINQYPYLEGFENNNGYWYYERTE